MKKWFKRIGIIFLILFVLVNIVAYFNAYSFTHYVPHGSLKVQGFGKLNMFEKVKYIVFGQKIEKSIIDKKPNVPVPIKDVTLKTPDGVRIEAWHIQHPPQDSAKGTVCMFHGATSSRSGLTEEIEVVYKLGWNIFTIDFRGQGASEGNNVTYSSFEAVDVKTAYDYVVATGEKKIALYGMSLGAGTIIKAISDYKLEPWAAISDGAFGSLYDAVKGRLRMIHVPQYPMAPLLTFWGSVQGGFWGFNIKQYEYAKDIHCYFLLQRGAIDYRVREQEESMRIFNNVPSKNKKLVKYANCAHESLFAKHPEQWTENINAILNRPE